MKNAVAPPLFATRVGEELPRRTWTVPLTVALHGVLAVAMVVLPLLAEEPLPSPGSSPTAFFVTPTYAPAPPPPPPPPAATSAPAPRVAPDAPASDFVAPIDVPAALDSAGSLDLGVEGGVPGGVEGGVPGGVVGGVVGGLPDALAVPPPPKAIRVGGVVQEPRKLKHVPPVYPQHALSARIQGVVILECTINPRGEVEGVQILRGLPLLDEAAVEAVRQWQYTPTLVDGVPMPVIMTVTVNFRLRDSLTSST
jgi:protein TonB